MAEQISTFYVRVELYQLTTEKAIEVCRNILALCKKYSLPLDESCVVHTMEGLAFAPTQIVEYRTVLTFSFPETSENMDIWFSGLLDGIYNLIPLSEMIPDQRRGQVFW